MGGGGGQQNATMHGLSSNPDGSKTYQAVVALVLQTEKEIAPWKKTDPMTTGELNSYIAVKLVSRIHGVPSGTK